MGKCSRCFVNESNGLLCATCMLAKQQEEQFRTQQNQYYDNQQNNQAPIGRGEQFGEFLGGILAVVMFISLIVWGLSDKGWWESVVSVVTLGLI